MPYPQNKSSRPITDEPWGILILKGAIAALTAWLFALLIMGVEL